MLTTTHKHGHQCNWMNKDGKLLSESTELLEQWREQCTDLSNYKLKLVARRRGNYEDSHSAKVTEQLILIWHPSNVMLRVMLLKQNPKENAEELVSGVQAEFRPKRSTIDQAFNITILIYKHVNKNERQGIFPNIRLQKRHLIVCDRNDQHWQVLEL